MTQFTVLSMLPYILASGVGKLGDQPFRTTGIAVLQCHADVAKCLSENRRFVNRQTYLVPR